MSYLATERSPSASAHWASGHPLDPRGSNHMVYQRAGKTTDSDVYQLSLPSLSS